MCLRIPGHRPDPSSRLFSCVRDAESLNVEQIFTQLQLIWQIRRRLGTERDCRSVVISRTYSLHASSSSCNTYLHFIYHHQCAAPPSACRRCCTRATVRAWVCARAHGHAYMPVAAYVYDLIGRLLTDIWGFKHILKLHMSPRQQWGIYLLTKSKEQPQHDVKECGNKNCARWENDCTSFCVAVKKRT